MIASYEASVILWSSMVILIVKSISVAIYNHRAFITLTTNVS